VTAIKQYRDLTSTAHEKIIFGLPSVCLDGWVGGWMDGASPISERLDGIHSYYVSKSVSIPSRFPINPNTPAPKKGCLQMGLKTQNDDFLENGFNDFD
jgi:hypothetical protein